LGFSLVGGHSHTGAAGGGGGVFDPPPPLFSFGS